MVDDESYRSKILERRLCAFQVSHASLQILFFIIIPSELSRVRIILTKPIVRDVFLRPRWNRDY